MLETASSRRRFLRSLGLLALGARVLLRSGSARAAVDAAGRAGAEPASWPALPKRRLGRTGFEASRLVFGCGAALAKQPRDALLDTAFDAGINVFDVGSNHFYGDAERNLAPFLKRNRAHVFLISKAMVGLELEPDQVVTVEQAKAAAATWSARLDASLVDLDVEQVDAYYLMATNNPSVVRSEEIARAVEKATAAGKMRFLGVSTHHNQEKVLEAAIETGMFSLAMVGMTPAGWYHLPTGSPEEGSPPLVELSGFLEKVRGAGIGLVGMKAARFLAGRRVFGWSQPDAFDVHYSKKLLAADLTGFQRSYAWVLAHGMDVVNADMQSFEHLKANYLAAVMAEDFAA
jgi:hypothetical protein